MTEKSEALRLADALEHDHLKWCDKAAAELRRLSAENDLLASAADKLRMSHSEERMELLRQRSQATAQRDALLEALKALLSDYDSAIDPGESKLIDKARAAIKAVEENT